MLSGHSRLEAAKKLKLKEIPARFFEGTEAEAIRYARVDANRTATAETLLEDISAFILERDLYLANYTEKDRKAELREKWGKRYNSLQAYSYLNPKGKFLEILGTKAARNFPYIENKGMWVGQLRKHFPGLTNAHENEMFDYLFGKKGLSIQKDDFFALVNKAAGRIDFDPSKKLHLERGGTSGTNARADTREAQRRITEIENELGELRRRIRQALTSQEKQNLAIIAKRLVDERDRLEAGIKTVLKSQTSLF
jgi:hypothetical protein